MPTFQIQLLGGFRLVYGETALYTINTPRLQAMLAYLLLHRAAPQARRQLAFLFWPESSEKQARTNLRHQFHLLRQALPDVDHLVQTNGQMLTWRSDAVIRLDVTEFESAACQDHSIMALQEAIDLYQGDLLPDCYDDWILPIRERLRQLFTTTLERLIGQLEQEHDYATAIRYAQRLRQCDPLHETTYRQLMRLYALLGDQAGVQRTYEECMRCLQRELDSPPTVATSQAYAQLVRIDTPLVQRHNLVKPLTPLIGRSSELIQIAALLADPACRLLTVVGAGGIGKSHLTLQAAWGQIGQHLHGVYTVALASIASPNFLVSAIADALGFSFHGAQEPKMQLLNYLHEKEILILLDNFEHLLGGAGMLVEILSQAPAVKLLVTSRERLKLAGEWLYEIHGLAVPQLADVAQGEAYAAVQLFAQNARRVQVDFALDNTTKPDVVHLCQLVEGMPLALELAASWVRLLTCAEIVQELTQSLDLLTSTAPTGSERHRSMRAVFDHSWDLLTPSEQQVFRRLAVFQGGFRREAANQVAGASLALLAGLVDKSLLRWNRQGRYDMHELIRQYADEKLTEVAIEKETTQDRHGRYFLELLHEQQEKLRGLQQRQALAEINMEIDNIRLACQWTMTQKQVKVLGQAAQDLYLVYDAQGWFYEGEAFFKRAAEILMQEHARISLAGPKLAQSESGVALGQVLARQSWVAIRLGGVREAATFAQQSLALFQQFEARSLSGDVYHHASMAAWAGGDFQVAQTYLEEAMQIFTEQGSQWEFALCLASLGLVTQSLGDYQTAKRQMQQGLAIFKAIGDERLTAIVLGYLCLVAHQCADYAEAKTYIQESLRLSRQQGDRLNTAVCLNHLGAMLSQDGVTGWSEAKRLFEESLVLSTELGDRRQMGITLNYLGNVTYALVDYPTAKDYFLTALRLATKTQLTPLALDALVGLATLLWRQPGAMAPFTHSMNEQQAAELLTLVLHHPATTQETKDKAQLLCNELASMLTSAQLVTAQERGQARTLEEIATELLAEYR